MNLIRKQLVVAGLGAAATAMSAQAQCVDFDPHGPGSPWGCCGVVFTADGVPFRTEPFIFMGGAVFPGGFAEIVTECNESGGHSLWTSNVNVTPNIFNLTGTNEPARRIKFWYADYGGSVNLRVNGVTAFNFDDFAMIPAAFFPGVNLIVPPAAWTGAAWEGEVIIEALPGVCIDDLSIGGQELCIDDLCAESCAPPCVGDVDGDGVVGFNDVVQILATWGVCPGCPEDLDGNGMVGFSDVVIVLSNWGPC